VRTGFRKLIIGFALESAIVYKKSIGDLENLYESPDQEKIKELHNQLLQSKDHHERAIAVWLEPAIDQGPLRHDPEGLIKEMREMEYLLFNLISNSKTAQREVNDWMNFVANSSQLLSDGFWIDAKIMLSRALSESQKPVIEDLKTIPKIRYEVDVLQKATESYFEEIKSYPLKIEAPANLEDILDIQEILLYLLKHPFPKQDHVKSSSNKTINKLSLAIRYMLANSLSKAHHELKISSTYIEDWMSALEEDEKDEIFEKYQRILNVVDRLEE
jgi:hypothetical protein